MKVIIKSLIVVYFILQFSPYVLCENIVIIESQSFDVAHDMDEHWKSILSEKGISAEIYPKTTLNLLSNLNNVELLIISNGLIEISSDQLQVIEQFIQQGGHVYLQSEYLIQSQGNQAFSQLVENLGGNFNWEGEMAGNLTPVEITNDFSEVGDFLPYFWYGAFGSGDDSIIPFLEKNNRAYGFYFCSVNPQYGKLITISDQDWIRFDMKPELMHQVIDFCLEENSFQLPQVQIHASENNPCEGEWITYSFEMDSSSAAILECQWYINDIAAPNAMEPTFTKNLIEGEEISCKIFLQKGCSVVEINTAKITLTPYQNNIMADIEIAVDSSNVFCEGTPITFIASPKFKKLPSNFYFQWFVNQSLVEGENESTCQISNLNENDMVSCILVYDTPCETNISISSNDLIIDFWEMVAVPSISIQALNEIQCEGESISFLANGSNLGDVTNFIWNVDGEEVAQGDLNFTLSNPSNGQVITCQVLVNSLCQGEQIILSPAIILDLDIITIPNCTLQTNSTNVCIGESAQVQIMGMDDTTGLQYQWQVNGNNVGTNNPFLEIDNIENSKFVQCIVTINAECPSPIKIITEQIQINIIDPIDIDIELFTNKNTICQGELVNLEIKGEHLPDSILYHWFIDNQVVQACTIPYFNCDSITDQQKIRCEIIIPEQECMAAYTLYSDTIQFTVSQVSLDIVELQPEICGGDGKIEVDAYDGVDSYSYEWNDGCSENSRSDLSAGDYFLTISDALGCTVEEMISIGETKDSIHVTIQLQNYDPRNNYGILNVETNATSPVFSWSTSQGLSCADCPQPLVEGGYASSYEVTVTDYRGCSTSDYFEMPSNNNILTKDVYIPNVFTPNDDGSNDYFTAYGYNDNSSINTLKIFNAKGFLIFERDDIMLSDEENGWDGKDMNNNIVATGVYLYVIAVQMEDQLVTYRGDVTKL